MPLHTKLLTLLTVASITSQISCCAINLDDFPVRTATVATQTDPADLASAPARRTSIAAEVADYFELSRIVAETDASPAAAAPASATAPAESKTDAVPVSPRTAVRTEIARLEALLPTIPAKLADLEQQKSRLHTDIERKTLHLGVTANLLSAAKLRRDMGEENAEEYRRLEGQRSGLEASLQRLKDHRSELTSQTEALKIAQGYDETDCSGRRWTARSQIKCIVGNLRGNLEQLEAEAVAAQRPSPAAPVKRATPAEPAMTTKRSDIPTTGC